MEAHETSNDGISILSTWCNSKYKQSSCLGVWKFISLSSEIEKHMEESVEAVVYTFVARQVILQNQLNTEYQSKRPLRHKLLN